MKFFKVLFYLIGILYVIACVGLYFYQDQLIFRADSLPDNHIYRQGKEIILEVDDDIELSCYLNENPESKGVILYLHGNKGNIRRCIRQSKMMAGLGYDIFMPDYRGYGKSDGQPLNEKQMYADVQKIYDHLKERYSESNIVIVGYSLGTGMASFLASQNKPKALFLIAPYLSMVDLKNRIAPFVPSFLLKYKFRNDRHLKTIDCPITLFHAFDDKVIPYDSSQSLKELKPEVSLVDLGSVGHRGSIFSDKVRQTLKQKLK